MIYLLNEIIHINIKIYLTKFSPDTRVGNREAKINEYCPNQTILSQSNVDEIVNIIISSCHIFKF